MPYLIIIVIVAAFVFVITRHIRQKRSSWSGVIIDKGFNDNVRSNTAPGRTGSTLTIGGVTLGQSQNYVTRSYYIVVKSDAGQEIKWDISEGLYQALNIGARVTKPAGTMIPEVTPAA